MNEIMYWVTQYNSLIIQIGFTIVLLLIVVYVYRLFFSASAPEVKSQESHADLGEISQKLNLIINQQKTSPSQQMNVSNEAQSVAANSAQPVLDDPKANYGIETVERLKSEILQLQQKLNDSEKKVFELGPTSAGSGAASTAPSSNASANGQQASGEDSSQQLVELHKKIENLQARLSEYDIIADDIAELSQLRSENAQLKSKISNSTSTNESASSVSLDKASVFAASSAPIDEEKVTDTEPQTLSTENQVLVDPLIAEIEKSLLNEFEKSTQKGS